MGSLTEARPSSEKREKTRKRGRRTWKEIMDGG